MMNYTLKRSRRKTVAIHITKTAEVEVRAPLYFPKADIDHFVISKKNWIEKHLAICESHNEQKTAFVLNYGDMVALQGKTYPISAKAGSVTGFDGESFFMPSGLLQEEIKQAVIRIYKLLAKRILLSKVKYYAKQMRLTPTAVKINSAKTRWGSCSCKNSINFSWRLIMACDTVIDYVVVHELAHIREHNHSDRFWAVVASVLPDFKIRQKKLKELQAKLAGEDWE